MRRPPLRLAMLRLTLYVPQHSKFDSKTDSFLVLAVLQARCTLKDFITSPKRADALSFRLRRPVVSSRLRA
jgi:hypothetical protein